MSATEETAAAPKKKRHVIRWIAGGLGVAVGSALIALPYVIQSEAIKWLEANGAEKAYIEDVDLNLFAGTFQIDNLVVNTREGTPLRVWQVAGDFNWLDLFKKRIVVQNFWLYGGHVAIVQDEDGSLVIGGIRLPEVAPAAEAPPESETEATSDWALGINALVLANNTVEYRAPTLQQDLYSTVIYVLDMHSWEPQKPAQVGIDMRINNQPFKVSSGVRAFADDPDTLAQLELQELNLADFAALAKLADVNDLSGKVSLKLDVDAKQQSGEQMLLGVKGELILKDLKAEYGDMRIAQGLLHYSGDANVHVNGPADKPLAEIKGLWESKDSTFSQGDLKLSHAVFTWRTATQVFKPESEKAPPKIQTEGEGNIDGLVVEDSKQALRLANVKRIDIAGSKVRVPEQASVDSVVIRDVTALESDAKDAALPKIGLKEIRLASIDYDFAKQALGVAEVDLNGVSAKDKAKNLVLADVSKVQVKDVALALDKGASVASVKVTDLAALEPGADKAKPDVPVVKVGSTAVKKISFAFEPPRLEINSVEVGKLQGDFRRDAKGQLYGLAQLTGDEGKPKEKKAEAAAEKQEKTAAKEQQPFTLRLESLKIADDSVIRWRDQSVKPAADVSVKPLALTLGPFDTAKPRTKTNVELHASLHKGNKIDFKGHISPLDPKPNSKLDGSIKALELTDFASYAAAAGYTLRSGRLDVDVTAKTTEGELDMVNKLTVTKLRLEGGGGDAKRDSTGGATALPLNVALGYLRDSNDQIKLDVPVTGNVRDPKFSFNDVIRLAMQAAAQEAALTYVTQALQPLGTVLLVGKLAHGAMNALQLDDIEFKPGEAALDGTAEEYAQKISKILTSRPGVKLTVCGTATEKDRTVMLAKLQEAQQGKEKKDKPKEGESEQEQVQVSDEALLKLADQRSEIVREFLVSKHKVNPEQLFDCRSALAADAEAVPSVTLGM